MEENNMNVTNQEQQNMYAAPVVPQKKKSGVWKGIVAAVLIAGVCGSTAVSAVTLKTVSDYIASQKEEENPETSEDYVTIAEQYEILPTTDISDAYKSGDTSKLDDKQKETLDMAKAALKEMNLTDSMTDFEKEKAVYDWMTHNLQNDAGALTVVPDTQQDCDNPYGVLKYHNAVCVGYATTFRMFMQMNDIECMVEHNSENWHSWDVVKLDDDWYITDIYSDAGTGNYAHFNMTNAMWSREQNWDQDFFPVADSMKYNMAYQNLENAKDIFDIAKILRKAMDDKKGAVMIGFQKNITEADAELANSLTAQIDNLLMNNSYKDMPYTLSSYNWVQDPETNKYLFCVYMGEYNSSDATNNGSISEEDMNKITELVNKAFDGLEPAYSGEDGEYPAADGGAEDAATSESSETEASSTEVAE